MSIYKSLQDRFQTEWINDSRVSGFYSAMMDVMSATQALEAKRSELSKDDRLSPRGIDEQVVTFAGKETVRVLKDISERMDRAGAGIAQRRAQLLPSKPDSTNLAEVLIRSEWRDHFRSMPQAELLAFLMDKPDPVAFAAAFEVPGGLIGLADEARQYVADAWIEANHPEDVALLKAQEEALAVVNAAIQHGVYVLQQQTGFGDKPSIAFDTWMEAASNGNVEPFRKAA